MATPVVWTSSNSVGSRYQWSLDGAWRNVYLLLNHEATVRILY